MRRILLPLAKAKELALKTRIDAAVPAVIFGDKFRLKQILTNLVTNAIKFTESGQVRVNVSAGEKGGAHEIRIDVCDTGIGIPAGDIPKLFQPFTQLDSSNSRRAGGSGLGLSICKSLAGLMGGGTILVDSVPGEETTFSLMILSRTIPDVPDGGVSAHRSPPDASAGAS